MAYSLSCRDAGVNCPGAFSTETESELMEHVELHARRAHPDMKIDESSRNQMKGLIKSS